MLATSLGNDRCRRLRNRQLWRRQWQNEPQDYVQQNSSSAAKNHQKPQDAHQRHIHVEVFRQTRAYAAQLFICARAHEPSWATRHRRHVRRPGHYLPRATVVTKSRSIRDVPLAAVANHCSPPAGRLVPALTEYTPKCMKKFPALCSHSADLAATLQRSLQFGACLRMYVGRRRSALRSVKGRLHAGS